MALDTLAAAEVVRAALTAAGAKAVIDVTDVIGNLPCILIPPPTLEFVGYGGAAVRWRLMALTTGLGNATAWAALDVLIAQAVEALPIETAEPVSYKLPTGGDPLPGYVLTFTGSAGF